MAEINYGELDPVTGLTSRDGDPTTPYKVGRFIPDYVEADRAGIPGQLLSTTVQDKVDFYQGIGAGPYSELVRYQRQEWAFAKQMVNIPGHFLGGLAESGAGVAHLINMAVPNFMLDEAYRDMAETDLQIHTAYWMGQAREFGDKFKPFEGIITDPEDDGYLKYVLSPSGIPEGIASVLSLFAPAGGVRAGTAAVTRGIGKLAAKAGVKTLNRSTPWVSRAAAAMMGEEGGAIGLKYIAEGWASKIPGQVLGKNFLSNAAKKAVTGVGSALTIESVPTFTALMFTNRIEAWQQSSDIINSGINMLDKADPNYDKKLQGIVEGADLNNKLAWMSILGDGVAFKAFTKNIYGATGSLLSKEIAPVTLKDVGKSFVQEGVQEFWEEWTQAAAQDVGMKFATNTVLGYEKDPVNFVDSLFTVDAVAQGILGSVLGATMGAGGEAFTAVLDVVPKKIKYSIKNDDGTWTDKVAKNTREYKKVMGEVQAKVAKDINANINDYLISDFDPKTKERDIISNIGKLGFIANLFDLSQTEHLDGYTFDQYANDSANYDKLDSQQKARFDYFSSVLGSRDKLAKDAADNIAVNDAAFRERLVGRYKEQLSGRSAFTGTPIDIDTESSRLADESINSWRKGDKSNRILKDLLDETTTDEHKFNEVNNAFKELRSLVFNDSSGKKFDLITFLRNEEASHNDLLVNFVSSFFKDLPNYDSNSELLVKLFYDIVSYKSSMAGIMNATDSMATATMKQIISNEGKEHLGDFTDKTFLANMFFRHAQNRTVHKLRENLQNLDTDVTENRTELASNLTPEQKRQLKTRKKELLAELDILSRTYINMAKNKKLNSRDTFYKYMWFKSTYNKDLLTKLANDRTITDVQREDYNNYLTEYDQFLNEITDESFVNALEKEKEDKAKSKVLYEKFEAHQQTIANKYQKWDAHERSYRNLVLQSDEMQEVVKQLRSMGIHENADGVSFKMHAAAIDEYSFYDIRQVIGEDKEKAIFDITVPIGAHMVNTSDIWKKEDIDDLVVYDVGSNGRLIVDKKDNSKSMFIGFTKQALEYYTYEIYNDTVVVPILRTFEVRNALDSVGTFYTYTPNDIQKTTNSTSIGITPDIRRSSENVKFNDQGEFIDSRVIEFDGGKLTIIYNTYESIIDTSSDTQISPIYSSSNYNRHSKYTKTPSKEFEIELDLDITSGPLKELQDLLGPNIKISIVNATKVLRLLKQINIRKKALKEIEQLFQLKQIDLLTDEDAMVMSMEARMIYYSYKNDSKYLQTAKDELVNLEAKLHSYTKLSEHSDLYFTIVPPVVNRSYALEDIVDSKGEVIIARGSPIPHQLSNEDILEVLDAYPTNKIAIYRDMIHDHIQSKRLGLNDSKHLVIKKVGKDNKTEFGPIVVSPGKFTIGNNVFIPRSRTQNGTNIIVGNPTLTEPVAPTPPVSGATPAAAPMTFNVIDTVLNTLENDLKVITDVSNLLQNNGIIADSDKQNAVAAITAAISESTILETIDETSVAADYTINGVTITYTDAAGATVSTNIPYDLSPYKTPIPAGATAPVPDPTLAATPDPVTDPSYDGLEEIINDDASTLAPPPKPMLPILSSSASSYPNGADQNGGAMDVKLDSKDSITDDRITRAQKIIDAVIIKDGEITITKDTDLDNVNVLYDSKDKSDNILRAVEEGPSANALRYIKYSLIAKGGGSTSINIADVFMTGTSAVDSTGAVTSKDRPLADTKVTSILSHNPENKIGVIYFAGGGYSVDGHELVYSANEGDNLAGRLVVYRVKDGKAIISSCKSKLSDSHTAVVKESIKVGYELLSHAVINPTRGDVRGKSMEDLFDLTAFDNLIVFNTTKLDGAKKVLKDNQGLVEAITGMPYRDDFTANEILGILNKLLFTAENNHSTFIAGKTKLVSSFYFDSNVTSHSKTSSGNLYIIPDKSVLDAQLKKISIEYKANVAAKDIDAIKKYNEAVTKLLSDVAGKGTGEVIKIGSIKGNPSGGVDTHKLIELNKNYKDIIDGIDNKLFYPSTPKEKFTAYNNKVDETISVVSKDTAGKYKVDNLKIDAYLDHINATNSLIQKKGETLDYGGSAIRLQSDFINVGTKSDAAVFDKYEKILNDKTNQHYDAITNIYTAINDYNAVLPSNLKNYESLPEALKQQIENILNGVNC